MPSLRDSLRRLSPRDPRDWPRWIFIGACGLVVAGCLLALVLTGHGG